MTESMWNIPAVSNIITPEDILKEQGILLTRSTNSRLVGNVATVGSDGNLNSELMIVVPKLNHYTYKLVYYSRPVVNMYNGRIYSYVHEKNSPVSGREGFEVQLRSILSSSEVGELVGNLLAQAGP